MPDPETIERANEDREEGKSPSTQAGEFVKEEMDHIREGKHGARNTKQAIAIGLSEARRAGIPLPPAPGKKKTKSASAGAKNKKKPNARRSRASEKALEREGHTAASRSSLSKQAKSVARKRTPAQRSASAKKAARTRARERH